MQTTAARPPPPRRHRADLAATITTNTARDARFSSAQPATPTSVPSAAGNTQGRALGFTVRGYVQEPTKDTVPVRELFPRRVCLRVSAKSHVGMVLGEQAFERGAWANRIGESEAGVGYVFGEGIREPLRVRAGWVPDQTIKQLETFITGPVSHDTAVLPFPTPPTDPGGSSRGGAA